MFDLLWRVQFKSHKNRPEKSKKKDRNPSQLVKLVSVVCNDGILKQDFDTMAGQPASVQ